MGDWDTRPRDEDRAAILERCAAVLPSLRGARVVRDWVSARALCMLRWHALFSTSRPAS